MTELREQLLAARDEYRSARYPGELAGELLPPAAVSAGVPRPWGMRTFVVRLAGVAFAAAAVVALVVVRPPDPMTDPRPRLVESRTSPSAGTANAARPGGQHGWWFAPDLTFASQAAERVRIVAMRVQMRVTLPYRDLIQTMPEFPTLAWPEWPLGRERGNRRAAPDDRSPAPQAGPSTQQAV